MLRKIITVLRRDLKHDIVYERAVGVATAIAVLSVFFVGEYPVSSILSGGLAALFGITCYFLRHR